MEGASELPAEAVLRTSGFLVEPSRSMHAAGYPWPHEIRVALPASYPHTERRYPVLWITDNALEATIATLGAAELILVGVGAGRVPAAECIRRRVFDFYPDEDFLPSGDRGAYLRARIDSDVQGGGASAFLDFLVDDVRTTLVSEYRMAEDDQGLIGFSSGCAFVSYSLFTRPDGFAKYIGGSGGLYFDGEALFKLEESYAAEHNDLQADVFLAAGDGEVAELSAWGAVSAVARLAEMLSFRQYPSLRLTARIFPGETHATMFPHLVNWGVRSLWGDRLLEQAL